jgi:predicted RNA-binding Zn-ribbon protein involved in translation (DUF1610 family)
MTIDPFFLDRMIENVSTGSIPPFCVHCGYNLTGMASPRCPECGAPFRSREWRRHAERLRGRLYAARDATEFVRLAFPFGGIGLLIALVNHVVTLMCAHYLLTGLAGIFGLVALSLGIGGFKPAQLPEWIRDQLSPPPNYMLAGLAVALGLVTLAATVLLA